MKRVTLPAGRQVLHIDFDSFFASVAQQYNSKLRGKPIGITATNGRTCIIAASREAKKCGIKSPSRTFEAYKICPSLQIVPADFVRYWEVSKKFLLLCQEYSPFVEVFSIDEAFMDVTQTASLFGGVASLVRIIKKRIVLDIGEYITASFGISHNKLLAKLASGLQKPNGVVVITPENLDEVYIKAKLTDICGIGYRICARLNSMGIYTLHQLRNVPLPFLVSEFGVAEAEFLKNVGLGIDTTPVSSYATAPGVKSVGRNYCLPRNEYDQQIILKNVYELSEEIAIKLRRLNKKARTVGLSLRGSRSEHGRYTIKTPLNTGGEIFRVCRYFYDTWRWATLEREQQMVRMISVWAENIIDVSSTPLSLFPSEQKKEKVWKTVDRLNQRFGDHTIRNGFLLYADKLTTVPNGYMADTYERIKLAKEVQKLF